MIPFVLSAVFAVFLGLQAYSAATAIARLRRSGSGTSGPGRARPMTLIVSIAELSRQEAQLAARAIDLGAPDLEVLFCAATPEEPAARLIADALREAGGQSAAHLGLLFSGPASGRNPKLGNIRPGYAAARHDALVLVDGNLEIAPDLPARLRETWTPGVALLSTVPVAVAPKSFWAGVEMALLTGVYARWLLAGETVSITYASGKILGFSRNWLETRGGLPALDSHIAEDMALTRLARDSGQAIALLARPDRLPLGRRSPGEVLGRESRWMKIRRADVLPVYLVEPLYWFWSLAAAATGWAAWTGMSPGATLAGVMAAWHLGEAQVSAAAGRRWTPTLHLEVLLRDLLMPVLWANGWIGRHYRWRGRQIRFR